MISSIYYPVSNISVDVLQLIIHSLYTTTASQQSWCEDIVMLAECLQSPAASHLATQQVDWDQEP